MRSYTCGCPQRDGVSGRQRADRRCLHFSGRLATMIALTHRYLAVEWAVAGTKS
jgi:hypothetical protein